MAHAVVRTDNMAGTDVRSELVSIKYMGADGATPTAIDNGNVLKDTGLMDGEREVRIGAAVAADDELRDVILVATPEVMYDVSKNALDEYYNDENRICRGYRLHSGDIFSVTAEALEGVPEDVSDAKGMEVGLAAGTKLALAASASGTKVGKVIAVDHVNRYTYFVIEVD